MHPEYQRIVGRTMAWAGITFVLGTVGINALPAGLFAVAVMVWVGASTLVLSCK